ncbi:MAG: acyltransferase family protein [Planctomycetaceae bacterium]
MRQDDPSTGTAAVTGPSPDRVDSLDVYRGLVMLLMMAEVLHLSKVAGAFPDSRVWEFLAWNQSHVPWRGGTLHDMIQPSFSFLVGAALPFSLAARAARGQSRRAMTLHALWRAFLLVALGIFLRSVGKPMTNFTFEDTLTQIGLGYPFLFLLGLRPRRDAWIALGVILVGVWAAWRFYPVADPWAKNANIGHDFDVWFLNLFPREKPFVANGGGYLTLSFIPTLATSILGLIAGRWLADGAPVARFLLAGAACLGAGLVLDQVQDVRYLKELYCPIVKRIWTPSWVLASGGVCFWFVALFHWLVDLQGRKAWAWPLVVVGTNSIAAYLIAHLWDGFIERSLITHLGSGVFRVFGDGFEPLVKGAAVLLVMWACLAWMWRRRIFLRV